MKFITISKVLSSEYITWFKVHKRVNWGFTFVSAFEIETRVQLKMRVLVDKTKKVTPNLPLSAARSVCATRLEVEMSSNVLHFISKPLIH